MRLTQVGSNQTVLSTKKADIFFSYETPVAAFIEGLGYFRTEERYSRTTSKHISQWLAGRVAQTMPQPFFDSLLGDTDYTDLHTLLQDATGALYRVGCQSAYCPDVNAPFEDALTCFRCAVLQDLKAHGYSVEGEQGGVA